VPSPHLKDKADLRQVVQDEIDRRVIFLGEPRPMAARNVSLLLRKLADVVEIYNRE
jgi:hypothetical protein